MYQIISYILSGVMMTITPILFVKIVLKKKLQVPKIEAIAIILIFLILYMFSQYLLVGMIKTIFNCTFHIILIKKLYNIDYWKTIMIIVIYSFLIIIVDALELLSVIYVLNIDKTICYKYIAGSLISNTIVCTVLLLLTIISKKFIRKILNYKLDSNKKLVILLGITLLCILYCFYEAFTNVKIDKDFYINTGIIIVFLMVLFNLAKQLIINSKKTMEYDKLLEFMKNYEEDIENERILRHETKNQLLTIKAKIYDKEKDKDVIKYIDSILDEKIEVSQEHYAKFQYLPANGLKALFYFKTSEAEKKKIKVSINISKRVENSILYNLNTKEFKQLGRLLGIYLDNAIEASEESKEKVIGIEIYLIKENIEIIISNSYEQKEKISINGKSSKGRKRGHGLILANNIINSSNNLEVEKTITEKLYIQKLIIKDN